MPITIWAARSIGVEFRCELVEYMRTIIYKVPGLKVKGPRPAPCIMIDAPDFQGLRGRGPLHLPEWRRVFGPV